MWNLSEKKHLNESHVFLIKDVVNELSIGCPFDVSVHIYNWRGYVQNLYVYLFQFAKVNVGIFYAQSIHYVILKMCLMYSLKMICMLKTKRVQNGIWRNERFFNYAYPFCCKNLIFLFSWDQEVVSSIVEVVFFAC